MLSLSASGLGKPDLANYVPNQRLEWKRYKQYTRNDIMAAIEEVKSGMKFFFCFYFTKTFYAQSILFENDRFSLGTHNNFCNFLFINIFSILALFYQNK